LQRNFEEGGRCIGPTSSEIKSEATHLGLIRFKGYAGTDITPGS
jgi:hypothetical protein